MHIVSDLHLHSRFSRAVSKHMTLPIMAKTAQAKGIDLLTASDWTHPLWFKELQEQLTESSEGIYFLKSLTIPTSPKFLLSTEISCIYKQGEKVRRIHNLVFVPSLTVAEKIRRELGRRGANLSADGRPIIGLSSRNLLELVLEIDERAMLIPCHVWTPHFGVFGSASGFDSLEEAFGDLAPFIYGIETGLSSDPAMNWQIPELATRSILSFSDAHSPAKMGREATVFDLQDLTYEHVRKAIMRPSRSVIASGARQSHTTVVLSGNEGSQQRDSSVMSQNDEREIAASPLAPRNDNKVAYTIEFYPEQGKYHYSGHRACKVSYGPEEIREKGTTCPVCHKRLTEGVMFRVQTLAGSTYHPRVHEEVTASGFRWHTDQERNGVPFVTMIPLLEVIAESLHVGVGSKKVQGVYEKLVTEVSSELDILMNTPLYEISAVAGAEIAHSIKNVRSGNHTIVPGYDGEFGIVRLPHEQEDSSQLSLL